MGAIEQDVDKQWNKVTRKQSVYTIYIDETKIKN
jgi:hypothetical protein